MFNIETKKTGDKLTIVVDLSKDCGASGSGKSTVIATTRGNVDLGDGIKLGLNIYRPRGGAR